jgi:hypothetical protein
MRLRGAGGRGRLGGEAVDAVVVPNEPRRWSWYLPLAISSLVLSSRIMYCSAALFTPTATIVRPLAFFSWHSGDMQ